MQYSTTPSIISQPSTKLSINYNNPNTLTTSSSLYNTSLLLLLHHSITPSLHPSLHHSITPSPHHPITPSPHHPIPSPHHPITPSPHHPIIPSSLSPCFLYPSPSAYSPLFSYPQYRSCSWILLYACLCGEDHYVTRRCQLTGVSPSLYSLRTTDQWKVSYFISFIHLLSLLSLLYLSNDPYQGPRATILCQYT